MTKRWQIKTPVKYSQKDLAVFVKNSNSIENIHHSLEIVLNRIQAWHAEEDKVARKMLEQTTECEIIQHYKAARWALRHCMEDISMQWINKVHGILMKGQLGPTEAGILRRVQVYVGNHVPPAPGESLVLAVKKFETLVSKTLNSIIDDEDMEEIFKKLYGIHCAFETIHPYIDGNGRSGRLLWLALLHRYGFAFTYIDYYDRWDYYGSLQSFQRKGKIEDVRWFPLHLKNEIDFT